MGWISKRFATQNRYKWGAPMSAEMRRAPLRKIVAVLRHRDGLFDHDWVALECGHEGRAHGEYRARCLHCLRVQEAASPETEQLDTPENP